MTTVPVRGSLLSKTDPAAARGSSKAVDPRSSSFSAQPAVVVNLTATAATTLSGLTAVKKDFATVATDARATIDAGYERLGKKADIYTSGADWESAFSGLDRRSLYAVSSNEGGYFSQIESDTAKSIMASQQSKAMGLSEFGAIDGKASSKAAIIFLDGVSDEEKTSFDWARARAVSQFDYELSMRAEGKQPENFESGNLLVNLIKGAMEDLAKLGDPSNRLEDMPQYKEAEAIFANRGATGAAGGLDGAKLVDQYA